MIWIAPSEKDTDAAALEKRLWDAADQFRANSGLKAQEYSAPVLGLIFLRFAEVRFAAQRARLEKAGASSRRGSRVDEPAAYHAEGILYLPAEARFDYLLNRPGGNVNSYYDDPHDATGRFDFVLGNPPFNVNAVDKERLKDSVGPSRRFSFGLPRTDNANYLWIQLFHSALNEKGRAGFVMANSASDARASEQEIRRQLIESGAVDVMVAVGPNLFYTVTLPCTLWFLDKGKGKTPRADTVLFIDARHIYRQVDRAHREWTPAQIGFLANLVRLYRGEALEFTLGGEEARAKLLEVLGNPKFEIRNPIFKHVPGLCRAATLKEIEAQGWSLNPGRYVGVAAGEAVSDEDFKEQLETLNEELETLNAKARELEQTIAGNVAEILET